MKRENLQVKSTMNDEGETGSSSYFQEGTSVAVKDVMVDGNVRRVNFQFETPDRIEINAYRWENNEDANTNVRETNAGEDIHMGVRGIIQIAHGMAEHMLRYDDFARHMVKQGFIVYGNDHRGHGGTIKAPDDPGFFAKEDGFHKVVTDLKQLSDLIREEHPGLPLFLLGHSLGSFLTRRYIQLYDDELAGVILSGTSFNKGIGKLGLQLAKWDRWRKGPRAPSKLMDTLVFYDYNEHFEPAKTKFDYLSRDEKIVEKYVQDEKCGFICSTSFFIDLLTGLDVIHQKSEVQKTPRNLPILLISGDMDPVGDEGKGVRRVYSLYKQKARSKNVQMKLYKDGRHEMLNEINRDEVYDDITIWLKKRLGGGSS